MTKLQLIFGGLDYTYRFETGLVVVKLGFVLNQLFMLAYVVSDIFIEMHIPESECTSLEI
jgi:hypothetical protein